ncbi:plasmid stability protein [Rhizobium aethiopicum]|nr:plasmid stability protein [Rhizobium aethiopicum]
MLENMQSMIYMLSLMNGGKMASMTIRNLDEGLKQRLRVRAATHGRSMEDEARDILRTALATTEPAARNLAEIIRARLQPVGGVELEIPPREPIRDAPDFDA